MTLTNNTEFKRAVREIAFKSLRLESEYDRVRCCEWVRKLISIPDNTVESSKLRNDYIQYLRIIVRMGFLHGIFKDPPSQAQLPPLAEALGSRIVKHIPELPPVGPISPYLCHKSCDGRAYISIKRVTGNGVMCYMAVSPDGLQTN